MNDKETLFSFLRYPIDSTNAVFSRFEGLRGAISFGAKDKRSLYLPGSAKKKVLLIAHADTYWEKENQSFTETELEGNGNQISNPSGGLGADDRAGCAIVWLLKDMGHSILITSGEERGSLASKWLIKNRPDVIQEINKTHQFMVQFDRANGCDFKCYNVGTFAFRKYIKEITNYNEPDRKRSTDIKYLCKNICGVNLSIGYHNEHVDCEYLTLDEWQGTLDLARRWLSEVDLPLFELSKNISSQTIFS